MPIRLTLLALAASLAPHFALAQPCPALASHIVGDGELQMSVNPTLPPQEFVDAQGELLGLNVDLTTAIAKRLCLKPVYVRMDSQGMIPGLRAGRFDMVNNGLFWTAERAATMFMVPYAQQGFSIVTAPGSSLRLAEFADLAGLRVGTEVASYPDRMARQDAAALAATGAKPVDVRGFANGAESLAALRAGQLDAILTIDETAASLAQRGLGRVQATGLWHSQITLTFRDRDLAQAAADALTAIRAEGVYDGLFERWGMARIETTRFAIRGPGD